MPGFENAEELLLVLERYTKLKSKDIPQELDEYLGYVARTGDPVYQWSTVQYFYREKLITVIKDFHDTTQSIEDLPQCPNVDAFNYETLKTTLLERLDLFHAAPFTIQRLSELLNDPRKHYKRLDKFMRALEKNILVVSTIEPGRKQMDSENGESVNGDVMLDVEMDKESAVAGSSSTATERPSTASHTTTSADENSQNTATDETMKENRDEDVKDTDDAIMTESSISAAKDDTDHKIIDIEGNEPLDNFKTDETDGDEPHIDVVDEDRDNKETPLTAVNKIEEEASELPENKSDIKPEETEQQTTSADGEKCDTDTEKLKNIFEIIADPFVDDDDDDDEQISSDSLEIDSSGDGEVVGGKEMEIKNTSDSKSCLDDDAESKTNSADEFDTSTQSNSVKLDDDKNEYSPSAAKIPRLNDAETSNDCQRQANNDETQVKLDDSASLLAELEPTILSGISSPNERSEIPATETQKETEQPKEEEEIPSENISTAPESKSDDAVSVPSESVAVAAADEPSSSVLSPSPLDIPLSTDDLEKIVVPEIIAVDANVEALLAAAVDPVESPLDEAVTAQSDVEKPAEIPSKSIEEQLAEIPPQPAIEEIPTETLSAPTADGITENPEKMSIEEMDQMNQVAPVHQSSSSTVTSSSGESAMEAAPTIPPSAADDEQMDVDESNSIDSMDL